MIVTVGKAFYSIRVLQIKEHHLNRLSFSHDVNELYLLPPITRCVKTICLALNYTDQREDEPYHKLILLFISHIRL